MISKFDHDSERFKIAGDLENKLLICQWLIDSFLLCRWHNDYLPERKSESNAIFWEIINETIRNENSKRIKMISENKNHSRSSQSKNLTLSEFVHFKNDDKISSWRNENFGNIFSENVSNQWKNEARKFEFATSLCLSAKNKIIKFCSNHFQTRHSLCYCKTCSISEKFEFESYSDRK
jgi:hypothetical protein